MYKKAKKSWPESHLHVFGYLIGKQLVFYYQAVGFIFFVISENTIIGEIALLDPIGVLNVGGSNKKGSGICLFDGLTAQGEIVIVLLTPGLLFLLLLFLSFIRCCLRKEIEIFNFKFPLKKISVDIIQVALGSILAVCFKLLICVRFGTKNVHYYFGSNNCYGTDSEHLYSAKPQNKKI